MPVAERMPAFAAQRVKLQSLSSRPLVSPAVTFVTQRREVEDTTPGSNLRVIAILERLERDSLLLRNILAEFSRPEPANAELFLQERLDSIDRAVLLLPPDNLFVNAFDGEMLRMPAVPTGDNEMILSGCDQDFFRMPELEVYFRKQ